MILELDYSINFKYFINGTGNPYHEDIEWRMSNKMMLFGKWNRASGPIPKQDLACQGESQTWADTLSEPIQRIITHSIHSFPKKLSHHSLPFHKF